ncbi:universal stress protein [Halorubellus sp. JP-L1]|uniref:universal stress protein n=1 Tax=Halorubellus sp. JP-L1 TaxID=2715753 RepID=UPI00140D1A6F|nr:universal stress protein [Halorubellus sp. JP-L1]NHN43064.1 universal stress protein [Halorubellus sp. JP-L1]
MPERVLVPFDGSPLSRRALEWTATEFPDSTAVVLYVIDQQHDETASEGWGDHPGEWEDWLDDREDHARDLFDDARAIADAHGAEIDTAVGIGRVTTEILDAIDTFDVGLVAIGLHGRTRFVEILPGETAGAVMRKSPVPVVIVRNPPAV